MVVSYDDEWVLVSLSRFLSLSVSLSLSCAHPGQKPISRARVLSKHASLRQEHLEVKSGGGEDCPDLQRNVQQEPIGRLLNLLQHSQSLGR